MKIKRISMISMKEHEMDLPITDEQINELASPGRRLIQDIFPDLSNEQREFLLTGITSEEWAATFGNEEEQDA